MRSRKMPNVIDEMKTLMLCATILLQGCTITAGIGGAIAPNVPREYIAGHEQFHLSIEAEAPLRDVLEVLRYPVEKLPAWVDRCSLEASGHHHSNGAGLGIGRYPNKGLDFIGTQVKVKLWSSERKQ